MKCLSVFLIVASVTLFVSISQAAQSLPSKPQPFEVAMIKPNTSGERTYGVQYLPGGRFVARNIPLVFLIVQGAYNVPGTRVIFDPKADPERAMSLRYDVEAAAERGAIPPDASDRVLKETLRLMVQTLLADRFSLVTHFELRDRPVYIVTPAKNGPKFPRAAIEEKDCAPHPKSPADPNACHLLPGGAGAGVHGQAVTMADFVQVLSDFSDRPVIDRSGLNGLYKIDTVGWIPGGPSGERPDGQPVNPREDSRVTIDEMLDMIGLKLEPGTAQVEVLVIDHIGRLKP